MNAFGELVNRPFLFLSFVFVYSYVSLDLSIDYLFINIPSMGHVVTIDTDIKSR